MWWMMARLAGWNSGTDTTTAPTTTSTITNEQPCPIGVVYGEYSAQANLCRWLRDEVLCVSTDNNPYGVIIELVQDGISQVHSDLLSIRVFTSMLENAKQGYYNGGEKPKFGFMTVDAGKIGDRKKCKLLLCHEEVEIIKSIYSWYLSGMGAKGITNRLNEDGCSYRGSKWAVSKVLEVLGEESYKGTYIYNQRDKKRKLKPREEWIHIPVERIIDNETWDKVQYLKDSRSPQKINPAIVASNSLLTGIAYCGLCNGRMVLESAKSGQYSYYQCRNSWK